MSAQLCSHKRLLTQYCNKLETVLSRFKSKKLETLKVSDDESPPTYITDCRRRLGEGIGAIETCTSKIEQLLQKYASTLDNMSTPSQKETADFGEYSGRAENILFSAFDYIVLLEARVRAFTSCDSANRITRTASDPGSIPGTKKLELPTLPIPLFNGNIWEWDNFWTLYDANVHSQPLPDLFKFNYLLNALKGDALNAVKKFQVTPENYVKALEFLKAKYGNAEELINRLIDKLDNITLRSSSMKDQRVLLEQLQIVVAQLKEKGEQIDSQWLLKQVLSKFPDGTQRKVLEKKQFIRTGESFCMETLLKFLDEIITNEEKITLYIKKNPAQHQPHPLPRFEKKHKEQPRNFVNSCMYCSGDHKSMACTKYATPQERSRYLREHKLCFICASSRHSTSECKKRLCFNCQGPHHTSCCFKGAKTEKLASSPQVQASSSPVKPRESAGSKTGTKTRGNSKVNHIGEQDSKEQEMAICELQSTQESRRNTTFLPTGEITVMDPRTRTLRKVSMLLDTGAELSFIDNALAEELHLPTLEKRKLRLRTFGSEQVQENISRKVPLEIWDDDGNPYTLQLLTHETLTKEFTTPPVLREDIEFIKSRGLPIKLTRQQPTTKPLILLGCDQLWPLIREDQPHIRLPSGLHLIPTRIGHLLTGQMKETRQVTQVTDDSEEFHQWDKMLSLEAQVNTVSMSHTTDKTEEQELWEKYWSLELDGTEEFASSEREVQSLIDQQVLENFVKNVEKREDGYYVRLPWKHDTIQLPDNRAIAFRRLISVWNSLQKDSELLEQYNGVFQEQLRQNVIEEVDETKSTVGQRIHYIPHQAVLTPHKTTTKLRIVFDASAHYKNSLSLNEALHRGPVILPKLYGLLLRFRIGRVALISDVEKAFLQVRLHELDRDATRCLWLRDHHHPPNKDNLVTFRFTRVTFGLLSSPFLLAATTHFHLDQYSNDIKLVTEIKENLYVDNLLLTTDTAEEAVHIYRRTKAMFKDMNMNLREFVSNEKEVMEALESRDKSTEESPKVLGIRWNSNCDKLVIACVVPVQQYVTKRTVASTIASIYDPMGWMLPLVHKAKIFLQSLWKDQLDWDARLSVDRITEWNTICANMNEFQKTISRTITTRHSEAILVTFADASSEAIASCVYLTVRSAAHLLMAKGKLPSLKSNITMPKMELNAMTLAMRLTNSVISQISSIMKITQVIVLSDSEIVLNWIKSKPRPDIGPFIRNRVLEIHRIATHMGNLGYQIQIGHISSQLNPADCATRGLDKELFSRHFWWTGPSFLAQPVDTWNKEYTPIGIMDTSDGDPEIPFSGQHNVKVDHMAPNDHEDKMDIFVNIRMQKLQNVKRVVAFALRFIRVVISRVNKTRKPRIIISAIFDGEDNMSDPRLSGTEIAMAGKMLVKQHQLARLTPPILKSLHGLNLRLDEYGIYRCFGRLGNSNLNMSAKYPMFVLQKTWLSELIIKDCHSKGHPSTNHTMSIVHQTYWIPKLRSQVTKIIRMCVPCQKFNNLAYKYPEQGDLPSRRVTRSRPFAHIGLDYFGPLQVKGSEEKADKCYGCIITCLVTRLIHLDIISDASTVAFLQMLRRFFARRGTPISITSDNSPTFALGQTILSECRQHALDDPAIAREVSTREIAWKYITPFAPWQGGVYERLIRSVKLALHKTLGRSMPSQEELCTVIIEIEAMLNTRPLLYVESEYPTEQVLRPIDFLQNEFEVPNPLDVGLDNEKDPDYTSPEEHIVWRTKKQVLESIQSSCKLTEKFWQIWQSHYLTSLREKHERVVNKKRGSASVPKKGKLVLISDALQPRHSWKMGRIDELVANTQGVVREAVIMLPSHRKIRRPLNLLVPLELDDDDFEAVEAKKSTKEQREESPIRNTAENAKETEESSSSRYNLRPKRRVDYTQNFAANVFGKATTLIVLITNVFLICGCACSSSRTQVHQTSKEITRYIRCIPGGVELTSSDRLPYEICVEDFCRTYENPKDVETVRFPPQLVLHEHEVQWKLIENNSTRTVETTCSSAPFCENIDCTLCTTLIFNPECWPLGAIAASAIILYFVLAGCCVFLYIPLIIGKPIWIISSSLWHIVRFILHLMWERYRRRRRPSSATDLVELLAIMVLFATISPTINGCQQVNVFSHQSTVCTNSKTQQICRIQLSEILKINPFKREACFKLMRNSTSLHEIRANWKTLLLTCEQETEFFTRDVEYRVIDSKRCSHSGSCVDRKCAAINSSSLIPELEKGNSYPGTTYCVESCGGPGCDCFYWSSGCLFYRIYASPISQQVFEIFHCNRWSETAKVEFTHYDALQGRTRSYIAHMEPNVPIKWNAFSFTLSSITVPPFPLLSTPFITDGRNTALWDRHLVPPLRCSNATAAKHLQCNLVDDCTCYPAETKANCNCKTVDISSRIKNLQYTLPATLSSITFRRNKEGTIQATIPTMTTSEIILTIQDDFKTDIVVDDALCTVSNTVLSGCYNCAKGAQARVLCTSSKSTQAEITCDSTSFTVKCDEKGVESTLHFSFSKARVSMICSVSCGTITSTFEVNGILKFTHTAQAMMNSWLHGETNYFYETQWPDLLHIADVFTQWYKTLFFTVCTLLMVLGMTYVCISSCGMRFGLFAFRLFIRVVRQFFRLCVRVPFHLSKRVIYSMHARRV